MPRLLTLCFATVLFAAGCGDSTEAPPASVATPGDTIPTEETSASAENPELGKPVENPGVAVAETYEVSVPDMNCPYGCYPTVAKTLGEMDGVASVRLADPADAQDGAIDDRRVFIEVGEDFDLDAALAKLKDASFPAEAKKAEGGA